MATPAPAAAATITTSLSDDFNNNNNNNNNNKIKKTKKKIISSISSFLAGVGIVLCGCCCCIGGIILLNYVLGSSSSIILTKMFHQIFNQIIYENCVYDYLRQITLMSVSVLIVFSILFATLWLEFAFDLFPEILEWTSWSSHSHDLLYAASIVFFGGSIFSSCCYYYYTSGSIWNTIFEFYVSGKSPIDFPPEYSLFPTAFVDILTNINTVSLFMASFLFSAGTAPPHFIFLYGGILMTIRVMMIHMGYHDDYYSLIFSITLLSANLIFVLIWLRNEEEEEFYTEMTIAAKHETEMIMELKQSMKSRWKNLFRRCRQVLLRPYPVSLLENNKEIWMNIFSFVGPGHFIYVAGVSTKFKEYYCLEHPNNETKTCYSAAFSSLACAKFWYNSTSRGKLGYNRRWLRQVDRMVCERVAKYGTLPVMKWARKQRFPCSRNIIDYAAKFGRLEILQYLHESGCPLTLSTSYMAAEGGQYLCLQYAHENGCPWDAKTTSGAALYGNLDCLQYAHRNGCPLKDDMCSTAEAAAIEGDLSCLQFAHRNGCPLHARTCVIAAALGDLQILQYAHENGCHWDVGTEPDQQTCPEALMHKNLHCFNYAIKNGCPCPDYWYDKATDLGLIIVEEQDRKYLVSRGQIEEIEHLIQQRRRKPNEKKQLTALIHQVLLVPPP